MSSVIGGFKCRRCGGSGVYDFDCSTQEDYETCEVCGLTVSYQLKRDENGVVTLGKDGNPEWLHSCYGGLGVVYELYKSREGFPDGAFCPVRTSKWSELRKIYKDWRRWESLGVNKDFNIRKCYIFKYNSKRHKPQVAFGGKYAKACLKEKMRLADEFKEDI